MDNYKFSIYNNQIQVSDGCDMLYNSYSHSAILVNRNKFPKSVQDLGYEDFNLWVSKGFIVNIKEDESLKVRDVLYKTMSYDSSFYLIINPTLECNCRCWYCYETHRKDMNMTEDVFNNLKALIEDIVNRYDELILSFFGGEPFIQFDNVIKPLMQWSKLLCERVGKKIQYVFTTNSLLIDEKILSFLSQYANQSYQITLDGGRLCHNKTRVCKDKDSYYAIVNTIKNLALAGFSVLLRLNLTHDNIDSSFDIPKDFVDLTSEAKSNITVCCQQVWQDIEKGSLSDKFMQLRKRFHAVGIGSAIKNPDSIRNTCYADKLNSAVINYDGKIFKCTAIDFDKASELCGIMPSNAVLDTISRDFKEYSKIKLNKKRCQTCRVWPLCAGGCYRKITSNSVEYCLFPSDSAKDALVLDNIEELLYVKNYSYQEG